MTNYKERLHLLTDLYSSLAIVSSSNVRYTTLIYFNSECEHCQRQLLDISKNIDIFNNQKLILISSQEPCDVLNYLIEHDLSDYYVNTKIENIYDTFEGNIPQTFIYEKNLLKQHFIGATSINIIEDIYK